MKSQNLSQHQCTVISTLQAFHHLYQAQVLPLGLMLQILWVSCCFVCQALCNVFPHCILIHAGISSPQSGTSPTTDSEAADYLSKLLLSVTKDFQLSFLYEWAFYHFGSEGISIELHACQLS